MSGGRDAWPFVGMVSEARDTAAADLAAAMLRCYEFVECFRANLAVERAAARCNLGAFDPEGVLAERLDLQLDRLRAVHSWAVAVSEGAADWHGGRS